MAIKILKDASGAANDLSEAVHERLLILRRFFTPDGRMYRAIVYQPRHKGEVNKDMYSQLIKFFGQDRAGVLVAKAGEEAVALFRTNLGYYVFDPADRDRYGRSIAPLYRGLGKACLSLYPCFFKIDLECPAFDSIIHCNFN
ncbi:hypothetical protein EVAR_35551_1 [Eumeta japonica]|uniref:Uncharacterized protein n=1 Tax=Eumeta variegata TaxID=151549 RepID=A0A4C1X7B5_EUMVA|nr:hypothetical protein EVAR_35551_1 [Eumeta japonica]